MTKKPQGVPQERRTTVASTTEPPQASRVAQGQEKAKPALPVSPRTAQLAATLGQPGVQVWSGVDGQGSVLRFFDLSPADKTALLAAAAGLGIHPVRR